MNNCKTSPEALLLFKNYEIILVKSVCFLPFFKSLRQCLACVLSRVQCFATPWTVAHQAPLSMGSSRQEYWSGFPCPSPGDRPHPGAEPMSLASPALAGGLFTHGSLQCVVNVKILNCDLDGRA